MAEFFPLTNDFALKPSRIRPPWTEEIEIVLRRLALPDVFSLHLNPSSLITMATL
jgi:hypothetical protein